MNGPGFGVRRGPGRFFGPYAYLFLGAALAASTLLLAPRMQETPASGTQAPPAVVLPAAGEEFVVREDAKARTMEVYTGAGQWAARFTEGARTVALAGPERTFDEATAGAAVVSSTYVRLLPEPFSGSLDKEWLRFALADTSPDVLAVAAQYVRGAPDVVDAAGLRVAGDADYGAESADGRRQRGADYNDFLGIPASYPGGVDAPEPDELGALDCSGFVRMVFGYRGGMSMTRGTADGLLPRRSSEMLEAAPGRIIHRSGSQLTAFDGIQPGDLVFFDAIGDDGRMDHVGVYMGLDRQDSHRFISSRRTADGPTLGDEGGRSVLDGRGLYAEAFRAVRRL